MQGDRAAPLPCVEPPRDRQNRVPNRLPFQPPEVHPVQQQILGIRLLGGRLIGIARHREGPGQHQPTNQRLQGPTILVHKCRCEIIQQLGMSRPRSQHAEVVDGRHNPPAKHMLPDPVHQYPRHQRVVRAGPLLGQFPPAAAAGGREWFLTRQGFERPPRDQTICLLMLPPNQQKLIDSIPVQHRGGGPRLPGDLVQHRQTLTLPGLQRLGDRHGPTPISSLEPLRMPQQRPRHFTVQILPGSRLQIRLSRERRSIFRQTRDGPGKQRAIVRQQGVCGCRLLSPQGLGLVPSDRDGSRGGSVALHHHRHSGVEVVVGRELDRHPVPGIQRQIVRHPVPAIVEAPFPQLPCVDGAGHQTLRIHRGEDPSRSPHQVVHPSGLQLELGGSPHRPVPFPAAVLRRLAFGPGGQIEGPPIQLRRRARQGVEPEQGLCRLGP